MARREGRTGGEEGAAPSDDPVLVARAKAKRLAEVGQRLGYLLYAIAIGVFVVAMVVGPTGTSVRLVIGSLVVGSLLLAPAIVLGYAVRAAAREDREQAASPTGRSPH